MADGATYVSKYVGAAERFSQGDLAGFDQLLAEDCTFEEYGSSKAEILKSFQQQRDEGWRSHLPLATAAAGEFLVAVAENRTADGGSQLVAGIMRFNKDGRITEIVARAPVEGQAGSTDPATHVGRWLRVVEAFNRSDLVTFGEAMAEECTWEGVGGKVETLKALEQGRDDGWLSHNTIGTAAAGEFLVTAYENRFADGRSVIGAGIARLDADGLFSEFVSREPGPAGTVISS